ncbi:hypothetical protein [Gordonia paraffinivorans]|uniref:hypothetical protein n=1 Tax=Gordonia paraffinivorans TaxID=175628 RepID=UPI003FCDBE3D
MKKDARLYAKFTLDFADSHKIMPLSDAAFRCLVEATLWSRAQMSDGFLPSRYAVARWSLGVLEELTSNDPFNPSLKVVDGGYQIHDFAEHQDTKADIEARRERNRLNGQKGGLAKSKRAGKRLGKRSASDSVSENVAETETHISNKFDEFWSIYPRKVGRKAASSAYAKAIKSDVSEDALIAAVKAYAEAMKGSDPKFIAHATTWLNQGRWDEYTDNPSTPAQTPEEFLNQCWEQGVVAPITERTGRKPDCIIWPDPYPEDLDKKKFVAEFHRKWIKENRDELVQALRGRL